MPYSIIPRGPNIKKDYKFLHIAYKCTLKVRSMLHRTFAQVKREKQDTKYRSNPPVNPWSYLMYNMSSLFATDPQLTPPYSFLIMKRIRI